MIEHQCIIIRFAVVLMRSCPAIYTDAEYIGKSLKLGDFLHSSWTGFPKSTGSTCTLYT